MLDRRMRASVVVRMSSTDGGDGDRTLKVIGTSVTALAVLGAAAASVVWILARRVASSVSNRDG
jgi:hypothetical protein